MVKTITGAEVIYLLDMVAVAKGISFDEDQQSLWFSFLQEFTYNECYEAFRQYIKEHSDQFLTVAVIVGLIKKNRSRRITEGLNKIDPPNGLTGEEYLFWLKKEQDRLAQAPEAFRPASISGGESSRAISA